MEARLYPLIPLAVLFLLIFLRRSVPVSMKNKAVTGEAFSRLIYTDEKGCKMLVDEHHHLQGKPDYIFKTLLTRRYIPYEIKSGTLKEDEPHEGDLMQLVAYFLLIEAVYNKRPPYGKLVYANKTFRVRNTRLFRRRLLGYIREMEETLAHGPKVRCKQSYIKCRNCICRETVCKCKKEDA